MSTAPIRIGGVSYQVGARLLSGLEERADVELDRRPPRELIDPLRRGELDAALLSSIESFRYPGYRALETLGIACDAEVRSVRLFLRCKPHEVKSLGHDRGSATSVALSKILLERRFGAKLVDCFDIEPCLQPDLIDADAVLLIGDCGMGADPGARKVIDLGSAWREWKDLPFVFALWLLSPTVADAEPGSQDERTRRTTRVLREAYEHGVHAGVEDGTDGSIVYELNARHREALAAFREEALALGLCRPDVEPSWIAEG